MDLRDQFGRYAFWTDVDVQSHVCGRRMCVDVACVWTSHVCGCRMCVDVACAAGRDAHSGDSGATTVLVISGCVKIFGKRCHL